MNTAMIEKANKILKGCKDASFGVIDEEGFPSVSAISLVNPENVFEVYFTTGLDCNKTRRLQKNNKASLCCYTASNNITLVGEAEILTDQETKDRCWLDWFNEIYEGGKTDPNYVVIKFTTKRVSLWIDCEGDEFNI